MISGISNSVNVSNNYKSKLSNKPALAHSKALQADTVSFSANRPKVPAELRKKAAEIFELSKTAEDREDVIQLRDIAKILYSGKFSGVLQGNPAQKTVVNNEYVNGKLFRTAVNHNDGAKVEITHTPVGNTILYAGADNVATKKIETYPNNKMKVKTTYENGKIAKEIGYLRTGDKAYVVNAKPDGTHERVEFGLIHQDGGGKITSFDADGNPTQLLKFNSDDTLKYKSTFKDGSPVKTEFFDKKKHRTRLDVVRKDGGLVTVTYSKKEGNNIHYMDKDGNPVKDIQLRPNRKPEYIADFEDGIQVRDRFFDEKGKPVKEQHTLDIDGITSGYDENGWLGLRLENFGPNNEMTAQTLFDKAKPTSQAIFAPTGDMLFSKSLDKESDERFGVSGLIRNNFYIKGGLRYSRVILPAAESPSAAKACLGGTHTPLTRLNLHVEDLGDMKVFQSSPVTKGMTYSTENFRKDSSLDYEKVLDPKSGIVKSLIEYDESGEIPTNVSVPD